MNARRKLEKEADRLYQEVLIRLKPYSLVSGKPTEVIHHVVYKSQSKFLRFDFDNGAPLTHKEHARHHLSGDPAILGAIIKAMGQEWFDDLQLRRRIICKFNIGYLKGIIEGLKNT